MKQRDLIDALAVTRAEFRDARNMPQQPGSETASTPFIFTDEFAARLKARVLDMPDHALAPLAIALGHFPPPPARLKPRF